MILPQTYNAALLLMILSLLCLGSWAVTFKLAGKWRFELYYFDYAFGIIVAAIVLAFTVGTIGWDGFSFLDDVAHAGKRQWLFGFLAGAIFNLANMLLMAAISVGGLAVAFPIVFGIALIGGVLANNADTPPGNAVLLYSGCALILIAVILDSAAYRLIAVVRHEALAKSGKAKSTRRPKPLKGIILGVVAGVLMCAFVPLLGYSRGGEIGLGPYSAVVFFSLGIFVTTFAYNMFFINLPVEGYPVEISEYLKGKIGQHLLGVAGGVIWCVGITAGFVAASSDTAHVSQSMAYALTHGFPLIAALWGIVAWKEFRGADARIKALVLLMLVVFACGLTLVSIAPLHAATASLP